MAGHRKYTCLDFDGVRMPLVPLAQPSTVSRPCPVGLFENRHPGARAAKRDRGVHQHVNLVDVNVPGIEHDDLIGRAAIQRRLDRGRIIAPPPSAKESA